MYLNVLETLLLTHFPPQSTCLNNRGQLSAQCYNIHITFHHPVALRYIRRILRL